MGATQDAKMKMGRLITGLVVLGMLGMTQAHDHHGEEIPEGEAVSAEPLVC